MPLNKLINLAQLIYYSGTALVLLGTGLRFLWEFGSSLKEDRAFIDELREKHLPKIYTALEAIGTKLHVDLSHPGHKPLSED